MGPGEVDDDVARRLIDQEGDRRDEQGLVGRPAPDGVLQQGLGRLT